MAECTLDGSKRMPAYSAPHRETGKEASLQNHHPCRAKRSDPAHTTSAANQFQLPMTNKHGFFKRQRSQRTQDHMLCLTTHVVAELPIPTNKCSRTLALEHSALEHRGNNIRHAQHWLLQRQAGVKERAPLVLPVAHEAHGHKGCEGGGSSSAAGCA
eukprot:1158414-Pelagomonas_calceolata.AAC.5